MSSLKFPIIFFCWALQGAVAAVGGSNAGNLEVLIYKTDVDSPSFAQISSSALHPMFTPLKAGFHYELSNATVWIKFRKSDPVSEQLFLELVTPNLHYVDFYFPDPEHPGKMQHRETGFLRDFESRPVETNPFVLPFETNGAWYYVRIRSGHFLNSEIRLLTADEVMKASANRILFYSVYAGIMLIIVAGAILFVYYGRQYHYFFYVGYIIFISTINLTEKGFYFQFLWPDHPGINFFFPLLPYGVSFCLMLFLKKTFHIDKSSGLIYGFNLWIVTSLLFVLTAFYLAIGDYRTAFFFAEIHGLASCFFIFVMNIVAYVKLEEYKPFLRLIIIGLGFFCSGVIIYLLSQNEVLPRNFLTENMIVVGTAIEVCLFTGSLSLYQNSLSKKYYDLIAVQNEALQAGIIERTRELQQKNEDLINSLEEKESLMNIVAHDLKSPLNQTKALSSLIARVTSDVTEVQELLARIQSANDHGLKLIDELNAIANLESNSAEVPFEKISVIDKLNPVLRNFETFAEKKNITLKVEGGENCIVSTHPPYLIRIIENLLSNAMKFSTFGTTVRLVIRKCDKWEILVCDQGPGFSDEDLKKVFRKFQKLSAVPTAGEHSTGLGLYIVKLLAERIKAELSIKSEFGRGSVFQIRFNE